MEVMEICSYFINYQLLSLKIYTTLINHIYIFIKLNSTGGKEVPTL